MSVAIDKPTEQAAKPGRPYPIIDCDVHPMLNSPQQLAPYLSAAWRERLNIGEYDNPTRRIPAGWFFPGQRHGNRMDSFPEKGNAGSDQELLVRQVFGDHGIGYGIMTSGQTLFVGGIANPELATTIVSAYNDWMVNEWLTYDPRLLGSIAVAPQDPARAADEIRRLADHPQMVQVFIPTPHDRRLGHPMYDPIWAAAQEVGLPVAWHPGGGAPGGGIGGPPTSYIEGFALLTFVAQAQYVSVITEGVFDKFPKIKFVLIEGGISWVLPMTWRLRRSWLANRDECPWMKRPPEEYLREHIRISTQPMEEPAGNPADAYKALSVLDCENWLMYASDYPHWDFDNPAIALRGFPDEVQRKIMYENPRDFYTKVKV